MEHPVADTCDLPLTVGGGAGGLALALDPGSGLPAAVIAGTPAGRMSLPVDTSVTLVTGGREVALAPHGLGYADTVDVTSFTLVEGSLHHRDEGPADVYTVRAEADGWTLHWEYTFRRRRPRLAIAVTVTAEGAADEPTVRDLLLRFEVGLPDASLWQVEAPGNELRPGVPATALGSGIRLSPAGGVRGSTGLVAAHEPHRRQTFVLWPFCRTEIGGCTVGAGTDGLRVEVETGLAGCVQRRQSLRWESVHLDLVDSTWGRTREEIPSWFAGAGPHTPDDRPEWVAAASIYEVQIGYSVFAGGYTYEPYPDARALLADLGRIADLGYDVLQVMPRQPYPSYNVHDYADVSTTYGDEDVLREVVDTCHALGIRVILDILLHGVIDSDVMTRTADGVRQGPFFDRLSENTTSFWGSGTAAADARDIAWSRHILDFEPYWSAGSPPHHPLVDEHPEWFVRDSAQEIIGIYTKAFDVANPGWQEYFCAAAEDLVRRLDVDGFRFDAPTYNNLPNWSEATRGRAGYSALGCLELFDLLRPRLKRLKESVMLYTEPSGVLFRQAMDVTYNYDEQWLIPAVLGAPDSGDARRCGVRDAADLAAWFRDRNAVLPRGSVIAHHVDSHDTFWWPLPGEKWRREQYGIDATRALLGVFALSGGAYMTFVGGEEGIEADVRRVHRLRADLPELRLGSADHDAVRVDERGVYAVLRRHGDDRSLVLVNLSAARLSATCSFGAGRLGVEARQAVLHDIWEGPRGCERLSLVERAEGTVVLPVTFDPYQVRVVTVRTGRG